MWNRSPGKNADLKYVITIIRTNNVNNNSNNISINNNSNNNDNHNNNNDDSFKVHKDCYTKEKYR